jgi:hypothetical protein
MDYQSAKKTGALPSVSWATVLETLGENERPVYYAWPEQFGSTTGPFKGIGGAAMSTFTVEAWVGSEKTVLCCNGKVVKTVDSAMFQPGVWPR